VPENTKIELMEVHQQILLPAPCYDLT